MMFAFSIGDINSLNELDERNVKAKSVIVTIENFRLIRNSRRDYQVEELRTNFFGFNKQWRTVTWTTACALMCQIDHTKCDGWVDAEEMFSQILDNAEVTIPDRWSDE